MVEGSRSDSETDENMENASSDESKNCTDDDNENGEEEIVRGGGRGRREGEATEYEKQRLSRIRENKLRLESLGLQNLASTLSSGSKGEKIKEAKRKGKVGKRNKNDDDDEEYRPPSDGEEVRVSSSTSSEAEEEKDEEFKQVRKAGTSGSRRSSVHKEKKIKSSNTRKTMKKPLVRKNTRESDHIDEKALRQAIALSLEGSAEASDIVHQGPFQNSGVDMTDANLSKRKVGGHGRENDGKKKIKKSNTSRLQMPEDQVIIHFFHFDVAGKGGITKKDLQRVATEHDFTWTDKEIADMIHCFDSDGDGKLSLEDLRKIAYRCNLVQGRENS